jgi:hypothetical protein
MMNDVIDRVLTTYNLINRFAPGEADTAREKIGSYLAKLTAAGRTDAHDLAIFGLAYLKELREGPNKRFTGC